MLLATNRFPGDGATTQYEFTFVGGVLSRSHVKVFQEDSVTAVRTPVPITDANFLNNNTLRNLPVTPIGKNLLILRETPKPPMVDFTNGSRVTELNLDTAARQGLFVAMEAMDLGNAEATQALLDAAAAIMARADEVAANAIAVALALVSAELARDNAQAAQVAAEAAAVAAASASSTATTQAGLADSARLAAEAARFSASVAADSAATSASQASASAGAAASSATAASSSKDAAASSASSALSSKTAAAASAVAASGSESSALASKNAAAASATLADSRATAAGTSATNAAASATAASTSASAAAGSASAANTSANNAASSASAASTSATSAGVSATTAQGHATNASNSASAAATSASNASGSATAAATSASQALASKNAAAASASAAATSELFAAQSALDAGLRPRSMACQLKYISSTTIRLVGYGGKTISIQGQAREIPPTGVNLPYNSGWPITLHYVYAYLSGGAVALYGSTVAPVYNADYGYYTQSGDPSTTLVGAFLPTASGYIDTASQRFVVSKFNQSPRILSNQLASQVIVTTPNLTDIVIVQFVHLGCRIEFNVGGQTSSVGFARCFPTVDGVNSRGAATMQGQAGQELGYIVARTALASDTHGAFITLGGRLHAINTNATAIGGEEAGWQIFGTIHPALI